MGSVFCCPAELDDDLDMSTGPKRFSYQELARSTDEFAETRLLGEGGFGCVYHGVLEDQKTHVAVKRLSVASTQGIKEFKAEVNIISRLGHKNLVELTGWCHETIKEKSELLLVYEYMKNGSLDLHLFKGKSLLPWGTRYKIARGLASALRYLHEEGEKCVLHRDIKSSNVMLDEHFSTKLGDFGLARSVDQNKSVHTMTSVAGTFHYVAPEYYRTQKASKKSDVFSFGVVTLEIACGKKPSAELGLVEWVWELHSSGTLLKAVDPRLGSDYDEEEIKRLMIIGLWCVHDEPHQRPSITQVVDVLLYNAPQPELPPRKLVSYDAPPLKMPKIIEGQSSSSDYKTVPSGLSTI